MIAAARAVHGVLLAYPVIFLSNLAVQYRSDDLRAKYHVWPYAEKRHTEMELTFKIIISTRSLFTCHILSSPYKHN